MNSDLDHRADSYVSGLAGDGERARIEEEMREDGALADAVARSRDRLLPLDDTADPVSPSAGLWQRILSALDGAGDVTPLPVRSAAREKPAPSGAGPSRLGALVPYALVASLLLSAGLGWMLYNRPEPQVVAVLVNDDGNPFALVSTNDRNVAEVSILSAVDIPEGQVMQVWTKPDPDGPPVSVGLIESIRSMTLRSPDLPPPTVDQLYEITVEQAGGSPTGGPTGPILGKGFTKPKL